MATTINPKRMCLRPRTSLKSRFTQRLLRSLKRLNRKRSRSTDASVSPREIWRRYLSVKIAADASMALAVGPRRAWSRALLMKIRGHQALRIYVARTDDIEKRKKKKKKNCEDGEETSAVCKAKELRKFVPGGEAMDVCSLLDEAAHYIKCLNTQVKVMTRIADFYSAV